MARPSTDFLSAAKDLDDSQPSPRSFAALRRLGSKPPTPVSQNFQIPLNTLGRLQSEDQFRRIVVKTASDGSLTYLRDVVVADRPDQKGVDLPMPKPSEVRIFRLTPTVISVLDYSKGFWHTDLVAC